MAGTFTTLVKSADFSAAASPATSAPEASPVGEQPEDSPQPGSEPPLQGAPPAFGSLAYNINIQLPESRDPAVYNAIFKALREHFR
jgi:hypothetical protein